MLRGWLLSYARQPAGERQSTPSELTDRLACKLKLRKAYYERKASRPVLYFEVFIIDLVQEEKRPEVRRVESVPG